MLRKRILAAATASILALGMSMGGAGAAFASHGGANGQPPAAMTGVTITDDNGLTCDKAGYSKPSDMNKPSGTYEQTWGTVEWDGDTFNWSLNDGFDIDFCVKGASLVAGIDTSAFSGTSYDFKEHTGHGISHTGFKIVTTPPPPALECITAVWSMPSWINSTTPSFDPYQTLVASYETECYNLSVSVPADCGTQYQIDSYLDNAITAALLEGGKLYGPNDPGESFPPNPGWGSTYKLVQNEACAEEPIEVPINLTYMTACAPDDTNTWRVRNGSDQTVTVSYRNAAGTHSGTHEAAPGDTFFETPRGQETMIIEWGGEGTGIVADDVRKASGNDEICEEPVANFIETSHEQYCGGVDITLRNVSPWIYPVTVEINGEASFGPVVDNRTDGGVSGPQKDQSATRSITFDEDSGDQSVRYRVAAGTESDLYSGLPVGEWTELTILTDCEPNEEPVEPTVEASLIATECDTDVPYILFDVALNDPDGISTDDGNVYLVFRDGVNEERILIGTLDESGAAEGRILWPGAEITDGIASGWPGWELIDGEWTNVGDENFGWTRVLNSATIEINPELEVELSYPPATPDCSVDPPSDEDPDVQFPTAPLVEPSVSVVQPTCDTANGSYSLSATEGVTWFVNGVERAAGTYQSAAGTSVSIEAVANEGFGFGFEQQTEWELTFTAADDCPVEELPELETLALTGVTGLASMAGLVALLITLTGVGMVAARRRVEV